MMTLPDIVAIFVALCLYIDITTISTLQQRDVLHGFCAHGVCFWIAAIPRQCDPCFLTYPKCFV